MTIFAGLRDDARFTLRTLGRAPGFALGAIATIALGIGATTGVFSMLEGVALRTLPYREPDRLMTIWDTHLERGLTHEPLSPVTTLDYRALRGDFDDVAAWWRPQVTLNDLTTGNAVRVSTVETSENLLRVLGVAPYIGHGFSSDSTMTGTVNEALISYSLWQSRYGGDRSILGKAVRLNGWDYTVVGVMPPGFGFPGKTELWEGLHWDMSQHSRGAHFMEAVARLRAGVTPRQASADLHALGVRLDAGFHDTNAGWNARLVPLDREIAGVFRPVLFALFSAAVVLLAIACTNVAALVFARALGRRQELAVRLAIGANPSHLIRLQLVESTVLGVLGSIIGVLLAAFAVQGFLRWSPIDIPRAATIGIDPEAALVVVILTVLTAAAVGLLPALFASRQSSQSVLKSGGRGVTPGSARTRAGLVIIEVGLAVTLLTGTGLLMRTVSRLLHEEIGVDARSVITAEVQLPDGAYAEWSRVNQFYTSLSDALRTHPEVVATGGTDFLPLEPGWRIPFQIAGAAPLPAKDQQTAQDHSVDAGYFTTLRIPILKGRTFDRHDDSSAEAVVIINQAAARKFWPGEDPIGRRILTDVRQIGPMGLRLAAGNAHQVIGVVADVKNTSLRESAEPALYFSTLQFPFRTMHIVVRGRTTPGALQGLLQNEVHRLDPSIAVGKMTTMQHTLTESIDPQRFAMILFAVFATMALTLAAVGIYGVLTYMIGQRRKEFGIRSALGATPRLVFQMVVREGLLLTLAGCAFGALIWAIAAASLKSLLYGVTPWDLSTLGLVIALVVGIALLACLIPGRRAASSHPSSALTSE